MLKLHGPKVSHLTAKSLITSTTIAICINITNYKSLWRLNKTLLGNVALTKVIPIALLYLFRVILIFSFDFENRTKFGSLTILMGKFGKGDISAKRTGCET